MEIDERFLLELLRLSKIAVASRGTDGRVAAMAIRNMADNALGEIAKRNADAASNEIKIRIETET